MFHWGLFCYRIEPESNLISKNMRDGQSSQFQEHLDNYVANPLSEPRSTYFHDKESFNRTFSKYGQTIREAVASIVWEGHSLDWVNLFREDYGNDPDDPNAGPDDEAGAEMGLVYGEQSQINGVPAEPGSYQGLSPENKSALMRDIITELLGNITDYKRRLRPEDKDRAARLRTSNYYRAEYSDQNAAQMARFDDHRRPEARNPEDFDTENPEIGTYEFVIKQAINELGKVDPNHNVVNFLLEFWQDSKDPYFGPAIATAISRNNAEVGAARILDDLKTAGPEDQNRLLSLLYRLELGRVGISEQGVSYLGRQFDVGMTGGFVSRLTADGKVGVFDELKRLVGLFQLESGDFTTEHEGAIQKNLQAITLEMLFTPRADETPEERAQKEILLEEFKAKYWQNYLEMFAGAEERSGFRFNNLSLPEQGFVLLHLSKYPENSPEHKRFFDFIEKFGEDGFRAFRSVEFDPEAGEKILDISTRLPINEVRERFLQYSRVYSVAEQTAQWVKSVLRVDMANPTARDLLEANLIREQILIEAQAALTYPVAAENQEEAFDNYGQPIVGRALSGVEWLSEINRELEMIVAMEPKLENFIQAQFILNRYLADTAPTGDRLSVSEKVISDGLAHLYNNREFSLRDYEGKTSDTSQSLTALFQSIGETRLRESADGRRELLVYDIGAGDGRMAIPLALSGCRVVGIDISPRMVEDSQTRSGQYVAAFRNGSNDHLVESTQRAFSACDLDITKDNLDQVTSRIDICEGNFNNFGSEEFRQNFGETQPDVIIIMWHTLGFVSGVEGMKTVLKNAYDILRPGGRIFIEMPDRNFGGYARAIREFHDLNPGELLGALRDAPSASADSPTEQNEERATWRYFPKNSEIIDSLSGVGFDVHLTFPKSYFVLAGDDSDQRPLIKENLFVATKPVGEVESSDANQGRPQVGARPRGEHPARLEQIREDIKTA